jgi:RNase adapter protein RapZ
MSVTDIVVIAGLSGAGRSQAAGHLEDLGWFVVDNMPTSLVEKVVELASAPGSTFDALALVVGRAHNVDVSEVISRLRAAGHRVRVLFLEAQTAELVRRYGATRRRHPLGEEGQTIVDAIGRERALLEGLRAQADVVIDTTGLNVHQLKDKVVSLFGVESSAAGMQTTIESFGFKHGLPLDVDMVLDCRFLPNPFWVETLRDQTGLDPAVRDYVLGQDAAGPFLDKLDDLLGMLLPFYAAEGKSYLTIAIGCTGGRHRSVAVAEELGRRLGRQGFDLRVAHRDIRRADH